MANLQIIKEILDQRNISITEFCKAIGMSPTGFKGILERNSTRIQTLELIAETLDCPVGVFFNQPIEKKNEKKQDRKPHIPVSAQAGSLSGYSEGITEGACEMNVAIPAFGNYDFTIDVHGDSMADAYLSGDIVACKQMMPGDPIWYGRVYVLDTAQGVIMKQVEKHRPDPSKICCVSNNKAYEPFLLSLEEVYGMSLVVGIVKPI